MGYNPGIHNEGKREGAFLCLRDDKERAISEKDQVKIIELISTKYSVTFGDTQVKNAPRDFYKLQGRLYNLLSQISSSEIVVTDRLHGMIFVTSLEHLALYYQEAITRFVAAIS